MIPELGHFALIIAFCLALAGGPLALMGAASGRRNWIGFARPAAQGQCLFVLIAFAALTHAFVNNDFSVAYVANHSNTALPLHYRVAAVWGGHEGSLLLWVLMLSLWMLAVSLFSRHLPDTMSARVLGVMSLISIGFLAFMLFASNPFERLFPGPAEGRDLNPLLQDPGMVLHPPMLYMGYVGFSVAYAFAMAALLSGRLDAAWARWSRPWTTVAWMFLTIGIALGSWWAYYELGWGGWWFWDPVENASFMPWLVGTALIHSLVVTEKRGSFRIWTVLLAICAFSMSLLGTFLVRSGVLTSVHAFATDPKRGVFILAFLAVVIGGSLLLFAWRAPTVRGGGRFEMISRESLLLTNNVLLMAAAGSVMLGTLYPLFLDALGLGKLSVGPPYFESVFVPLMTPALFLMGLAPLARWKQAALPELLKRVRWAFGISLVTALLLPFTLGTWRPLVAFGLLLALWIATTALVNLYARLSVGATRTLWSRLRTQPAGYYGMLLAHCGVAVFIVGVTLVKGYESELDVKMATGDVVSVAGYEVRFDGVSDVKGPNYMAARGTMTILRDGRELRKLYPEKRMYLAQRMPMTEAAIDAGFTRDLYVALGESVGVDEWTVRVYYKPFVDWIWGGCLFMALGGFFAVIDRRYRVSATAAASAATAPAAA
jgi:cytochrome c-type biogenesis protein CcmF